MNQFERKLLMEISLFWVDLIISGSFTLAGLVERDKNADWTGSDEDSAADFRLAGSDTN